MVAPFRREHPCLHGLAQQRLKASTGCGNVGCVRVAACHELLSGARKRQSDVDLPPDPDRDVNMSGHLRNSLLWRRTDWL